MKRFFTPVCAFTAVLATGAAHANGLRVVSQDAFAAARGEAFVATADNAAAAYYNPAGLTQLTNTQFRAGIYGLHLDPTFQPPATAPNAGETYDINKKFAFVPDLYLAHTLESAPLSFGLAINAPFGGTIAWPDDTGFRTVATKGTTVYLRFNPVVAWKISDALSIGGGLSANFARVNLQQGLQPFSAPLVNYFHFSGQGWALGGNAGVRWQPLDWLAFGGTFRSQTSFKLEGRTDIEQQPVIGLTSLPASAHFEFPLEFGLGVSVRPTPEWNVEFNADYTEWSSFGDVLIRQQGTPPFPIQQNVPVRLRWTGSWNYSVGVTRYLPHGWRISAGYLFDQNSVPDAYYTPLAADLDRHFFSVGVGRSGEKIDFDVTYQFGYGPAHTVSGSQPSATPGFLAGQSADGTYEFISHAVLASVGYRF